MGGIPGTNIVDLNSIPSYGDLIERLEVTTGGASEFCRYVFTTRQPILQWHAIAGW